MKYKGIELKEITEPQAFNPPKLMLVWDHNFGKPVKEHVYAIGPSTMKFPVRTISEDGLSDSDAYECCSDIPEEPKPRKATNREVAKWLAQGNGEWGKIYGDEVKAVNTSWWYEPGFESGTLQDGIRVRKWDDTDWHEPTADYMGLEGK